MGPELGLGWGWCAGGGGTRQWAAELPDGVGGAYDLEQHPIAQRYLIQAPRLAQAAGQHALGGEILAAMAAQAAYLGDGSGAVDLARTAAALPAAPDRARCSPSRW